MTFRKLLLTTLAALALMVSGATRQGAAAPLPTEAEALKSVYSDQVTLLRTKRDVDLQVAVDGYQTGLLELERQYLASGDLKPLLAIRKEKDRFADTPSVADVTPATFPVALGALQQNLLQACKDAKVTCAKSIIDLSQRYRAHLGTLQKDLTRQDRIEDALAIMSETESIPTYPDVVTAQQQIDAGGTLPVEASSGTKVEVRKIDTKALEDYFHARITGWNSISHQVTCSYDFRNEDQLAAWKGASFDALRNRMICNKQAVWLKGAFASVSKVRYDGYHYAGSGPIRFMLGKSLFFDVEPGADGKALLHQGNAHYPLHKSHGGAQPYMRYASEVAIKGNTVQWKSGNRSFPAQDLQKPIIAPVTVGFGQEHANAMFDNIAITGVLSAETMRAISEDGK